MNIEKREGKPNPSCKLELLPVIPHTRVVTNEELDTITGTNAIKSTQERMRLSQIALSRAYERDL